MWENASRTARGAVSAAARLADATGARLGWVPRRAGERGALDAGALSGLLPGGRPLADAAARQQAADVWGVGVDTLPRPGGRDLDGVVAACSRTPGPSPPRPTRAPSTAGAVLVAGRRGRRPAGPGGFLAALRAAPFVVSLEQRRSEVTGAPTSSCRSQSSTEKAGTFLDWEGRRRPFAAVIPDSLNLSDGRVLALLAEELGVKLGRGDVASRAAELAALGAWAGERPAAPSVAAAGSPSR